jgi:predicted metal-dependent enzyme (double-stranded beta helix superfamily)
MIRRQSTCRTTAPFIIVHSPVLDAFIAEVQQTVRAEPDRAQAVKSLRPAFARLLGDKTWLPAQFTQPDPSGGMAAGVGNYLIYRSAERDLSLMSLVLPAGAGTPVHDHLAWGLVGLYSGEQEEWVYRRTDSNGDEGAADLTEIERRHLQPGDFYELLPPEGDIHRVRTAGHEPSVSLHLLGNDIGCIWRHRYEPHEHRVYPFRSGYSNEACAEETTGL